MFINDLRIHQLLKAGHLVIDPRLQDAHDIGPFTVELRLGTQFAEFEGLESSSLSVFDTITSDFQAILQTCYRSKLIEFGEAIVLHPR